MSLFHQGDQFFSYPPQYYTALLKPASDKLAEELKNIEIHDMKIPVITNDTGEVKMRSILILPFPLLQYDFYDS